MGFGGMDARPPSAEPDQVHGDGSQDVLQMGFGEAKKAGATQLKGTDGLGVSTFNTSALTIEGFKLRRRLALASSV